MIFASLLGALSITNEIRSGMIRPTFLATPRRARVITAKVAASLIGGVLFGLCAEAVAIGVGASGLTTRGIPIAPGAGDFRAAARRGRCGRRHVGGDRRQHRCNRSQSGWSCRWTGGVAAVRGDDFDRERSFARQVLAGGQRRRSSRSNAPTDRYLSTRSLARRPGHCRLLRCSLRRGIDHYVSPGRPLGSRMQNRRSGFIAVAVGLVVLVVVVLHLTGVIGAGSHQ